MSGTREYERWLSRIYGGVWHVDREGGRVRPAREGARKVREAARRRCLTRGPVTPIGFCDACARPLVVRRRGHRFCSAACRAGARSRRPAPDHRARWRRGCPRARQGRGQRSQPRLDSERRRCNRDVPADGRSSEFGRCVLRLQPNDECCANNESGQAGGDEPQTLSPASSPSFPAPSQQVHASPASGPGRFTPGSVDSDKHTSSSKSERTGQPSTS
jgi:hypothetical protein